MTNRITPFVSKLFHSSQEGVSGARPVHYILGQRQDVIHFQKIEPDTPKY